MTALAPRSESEHRSPTPSRPITAERYVSHDYQQREWQRVWPRVWQFAALASDLREPGEYVVYTVGRESILVGCGDDGDIRAFYNVCQHRGARVVVNDRGWQRDFTCPYHGWRYDQQGVLTHVPDEQLFARGVDCAERSLKPVRCEVWAGMVWVCMSETAPALVDWLGPVVDEIEPYRLAEMTLVEDQTVRLNCNWKAVFDNFGELYHVEHIHPQHATIFDCPTAEIGLYRNGHTGVFIQGFTVNTRLPIPDRPTKHMASQMRTLGMNPDDYEGRVLDVRRDVQVRRREVGPSLGFDYAALSDEQLSDIVQFNVFPNTMVTIQPDNLLVMRARPDPVDPNWCWWDKFTFLMLPDGDTAARAGALSFTPRADPRVDPGQRPEHDEFTQDDIIEGRKSMTITIDQDIHLIRDVQAGMHSRGFADALLNDEEVRVQHWHDWMNHFMGD